MTYVWSALEAAAARDWRTAGRLSDLPGRAGTPTLCAAFGLDSPDEDDAALTCLAIAGLDALRTDGPRLVAVVEVDACAVHDLGDDFGCVRVSTAKWADVRALYVDEPDADDLLEAARTVVGTQPLDDAWESPAVVQLLRERPLLWHDPTELDAISGCGEARSRRD